MWGLNDLGKRQIVKAVFLGAVGHAGGILVMWDRRVVVKTDVVIGEFSVSCCFKSVENDKSWLFSGVYGPCSDAARHRLWEELRLAKARWQLPWCVGGDLNVIRFPRERSGSHFFTRAMREFNEFINEAELVDLQLSGGDFTWFRNGDRNQWSRIDRFLISTDWEDFLSGTSQFSLPRVASDDAPLLLECGGFTRGKSPFRFENMWLKHPDFVEW